MKVRVFRNNDVKFLDDDGIEHGDGFIDKDTKGVSLVRCPVCRLENYAMNVMSGDCTWCNFESKKCEFE